MEVGNKHSEENQTIDRYPDGVDPEADYVFVPSEIDLERLQIFLAENPEIKTHRDAWRWHSELQGYAQLKYSEGDSRYALEYTDRAQDALDAAKTLQYLEEEVADNEVQPFVKD